MSLCPGYTSMGVGHSVLSDSATPWTAATRLLCPWDSLGQNTGVGCHALLQGIFLTQGWNPGLPHCRHVLCHLSHQGSLLWDHTFLYIIDSLYHDLLCKR